MSATTHHKLEVESVWLSVGSVQAMVNVSLDVDGDDILAVMGPNGAAKTSPLDCISGFYRPFHGQIRFEGSDISRLSPRRRAMMGISRTFQNIEIYTGLSTLDNVMAAMQRR